jgi:PAS domain S-box-containing protein
MIFDEISCGVLLHELVYDASGNPNDIRILSVNPYFETLTGISGPEIVNKKFTDVQKESGEPLLQPLSFYTGLLKQGGSDEYEAFLAKNQKWCSIKVFPVQENTFVTIINDITELKQSIANEEELLNLSRILVDTGGIELDYNHLTNVLRKLSGAAYGILNLYSDDGLKFRNIAVTGNQDLIIKSVNYLGYNLKNKEWNISESRLKVIKGGNPVRFESIYALASEVIPEALCNTISKVFNIGSVYVVEIAADKGVSLGDFILIFEKENELLNPSSVSAYANMVGIAIARRKTEEDIQKSQNNLDNFFNAGIDFHWVLDQKGCILAVNETVRKRLGFTEEELLGQSVLCVHPPEFHQEAGEVMASMLNGSDIPCFIPIITKSGFMIPVETYVVKGEWNGLPALFGVSRDISELKISEEKFFKAFNNSPTIIGLSTIEDGVYVEVNQTFYDLLGFKPHEVIGKNSSEVLKLDKEFRNEIIESLNNKGSLRNFETILYTKEGRPVNVQLSAEKIKIQGREMVLTIAIDVTEQVKAEKELLEAKVKAEESDRLKTAFLANMSHEIRTPMNGIIGFLSLLREPDLSDENKAAYINIVTMSGQRLLDTINDIIEISRIETGELNINYSDINISELVGYYKGFFTHQAEKKGLRLIVSETLPENVRYFKSDRNKLDSIVSNLMKNAIKFTQNGSVELGCYLENSSLLFYVNDTGIGIPGDKKDRIFERFVQVDVSTSRQHEGSGLGLAIVKGYIDLLGGEIRVESSLGKGTRIAFSIPYLPAVSPSQHSVDSADDEKPLKRGIKILIAEDDYASYLYLHKALADTAISIVRTLSGEDTVLCVQEDPSISVVLMDIKLAGMSGLEATRKIREFNSSIPIIAQTAYSLYGDRELAINSGCTDYISKPVDRQELKRLLKKYT